MEKGEFGRMAPSVLSCGGTSNLTADKLEQKQQAREATTVAGVIFASSTPRRGSSFTSGSDNEEASYPPTASPSSTSSNDSPFCCCQSPAHTTVTDRSGSSPAITIVRHRKSGGGAEYTTVDDRKNSEKESNSSGDMQRTQETKKVSSPSDKRQQIKRLSESQLAPFSVVKTPNHHNRSSSFADDDSGKHWKSQRVNPKSRAPDPPAGGGAGAITPLGHNREPASEQVSSSLKAPTASTSAAAVDELRQPVIWRSVVPPGTHVGVDSMMPSSGTIFSDWSDVKCTREGGRSSMSGERGVSADAVDGVHDPENGDAQRPGGGAILHHDESRATTRASSQILSSSTRSRTGLSRIRGYLPRRFVSTYGSGCWLGHVDMVCRPLSLFVMETHYGGANSRGDGLV